MELMRTSMRGSGRIRPGETALFALEAEPGLLSAALWSEAFFVFEISGERRAAPQTISVVIGPGACDPNEGSVTPGPVVINVRNETQRQAIFGIVQSPPRAIEHGMLTFWPFLSGKRLLMTQTFRDTSARRSRQLPGPAASGCYRRVSPIPVRPGERRLIEPTATTRPGGADWSSCPTAAVRYRSAQLGGFETFALSRGQPPAPLATTVKLGQASGALGLCTKLNAATGRRRPFSSRFPRSSSLTTASAMRLLIRICPSLASAQSRAARLHTVPIAV